jgi:5-methylcytosine-specific restriction endonuclease McrA
MAVGQEPRSTRFQANNDMSKLGFTRDKIYKTVARQLHGKVPCWMCGEHVAPADATLEHIQPLSEGGNSHAENLAISHGHCNHQRHAQQAVPPAAVTA